MFEPTEGELVGKPLFWSSCVYSVIFQPWCVESALDSKVKVAFVPFLLKGVALNPSYNLDDGKHPNPEGVKLITKNLEGKLINLLSN